tara:strand:+ start:1720 stop:6597 length:4878 start_codon:yes stop_codon:yes gene_type:complete
MAICPNTNSPEWKELVKAQGEEQAYFLWNNFDGSVPGEYTNTVPVESNLSKVKELIAKMGVNLTDLQTYVSQNPDMDVRGANSIADAVGKIIAVSEGATQEDITEEMVHIATQILEQQNPELVTEMISKIGGFKIYGETLEKYREVPAYQLPDGRPNIRKIKKEAADKLIAYIVGQQMSDVTASDTVVEADELTEEDRSLFKRIWDSITGWFRGMYAESNVDIFQKIAGIITTEGVEGELLDGTARELYFTLTDPQKKIQDRILNTKKNIRKIESNEPINPLLQDEENGNSFYEVKQGDEYVRVKNRVTDRVKRWYRQRFPGDPNFTKQEKIDNNVKRELGVEFHNMFEDIHARFFNADGTRRQVPGQRMYIADRQRAEVHTKLEKYYTDLIASFSKNGRNPLVFSEVMVYDSVNDEAGTIDLLIVEQDGKTHIYDWKFMSMGKNTQDVAWYKQGAFNEQLKTYRSILQNVYNVKDVGKTRAVPIALNLKRENFQDQSSDLQLTSIAIGSVVPKKGEETPLALTVVPVTDESTNIPGLDKLLKKLNKLYDVITDEKVTDESSKSSKRDRLNILKKAVRLTQANLNVKGILDAVSVMKNEGDAIIAEYITTYEGVPPSENTFDNKQLNDFSDRMNDFLEQSIAFEEINVEIAPLIPFLNVPENQKQEVQDQLNRKQQEIMTNRTEVQRITGEYADKFIGNKHNVTGLLNPTRIIKNLSAEKLFTRLSDIGLPSLRILSRAARRAQDDADSESKGYVNRLMAIRKKLVDRGGNLAETVRKIYRQEDGSLVNHLIYKYQREFYDKMKDNAAEGNRSKQWIFENVDIEAYKKEAIPLMQRDIAKYNSLYATEDLQNLREKAIQDTRKKYDIDRRDFNGWSNEILAKHPKDKWISKEYKDLTKDKDLFALYNLILEINSIASDIGYLQNKAESTFLPFISKGTAESLSWDYGLSAVQNWGKAFTRNAEDVGYGKINALTGETINGIPKYYTYDFSNQDENNPNNMSDVSLELFKNQILYINHVHKYKYISEIEGQMKLVKTVMKAKDHYKTNWIGNVVQQGNENVIEQGNDENTGFFDQFLKNILYDQKYTSDIDQAVAIQGAKKGINKITKQLFNKEAFSDTDKPSYISIVKVMEGMNSWFTLKTLGLEPISGAVNAFGAAIQVIAQSGKYFTAAEFRSAAMSLIGNRFRSGEQKEAFVQLEEIFQPLKDSPTYDALRDAGITALTRRNLSDDLFFFFRQPELLMERAIFKVLIQNMMVVDGNIVNIRDFVKNKYKNRYKNADEYNKVIGEMNKEMANLSKNKSIFATKKMVDGKVVIPGFDLNNRSEVQRLTNIARDISRTATGGFTDFDDISINMNIFGKSAMVFKSWIPKLVATRFQGFKKMGDDFGVEIKDDGTTTGEVYDIGRARLFASFLSLNLVKAYKNIKGTIILDDNGLTKIDELYKKYSKQYEQRTGERLNMSKEDFIDMVRNNMRNQTREFIAIAVLTQLLMVMGYFEPEDNATKAEKNFFRYAKRTLARFSQELLFFYNPAEWNSLLSQGLFPSLGLFDEITRFFDHFMRETTGMDGTMYATLKKGSTPSKVRKQAQPVKYLMKMFPLTKGSVNWFAVFSDDFAREFDVTIPSQNRR